MAPPGSSRPRRRFHLAPARFSSGAPRQALAERPAPDTAVSAIEAGEDRERKLLDDLRSSPWRAVDYARIGMRRYDEGDEDLRRLLDARAERTGPS